MPGRLFAAALAASLLAAPAAAQVTMVIAWPAGGATDISGRIMQPVFAEALGEAVIIKNVTGAAGTIGTLEVARARPDGKTILITPVGPVMIQPQLRRNVGYTIENFTPICQVLDSPVIMMTPKTSGLRTLADVIAKAKTEPGAFPYASTGPGTIPHISMVAFERGAGISMNHIPYRGSGQVMQAFGEGSVTLFNDQSNLIRQYDLHPIAIFSAARSPDFPDTPTMRELGHDHVYSIWSGIYGPAGMAPDLVARFERACLATMANPQVREGLARVQIPIVVKNAAEFAAFGKDQYARFGEVIKAANLVLD
ncbi:tripartite tricarboxylate transporter substrate binding protein [Elioraea sp.]|uniref:tripartite tricarboxylate transporter substrate binding protein n=1 Tax=Elioraea sp. TaxID=2185103 RepID=UPI003F711259